MNARLLLWLIPTQLITRRLQWLWWVVLSGGLLAGLWYSADSNFGRASGLYEVRYRADMARQALFWWVRAARGASKSGEVAMTYRGYIDRGQGQYLLVYLYSGEGRVRQVVSLANVNNQGANLVKFAERYRGKPLRFDLFILPHEKQPRALIWLIDRPLNLDVIEDGAGPDVNPPTDVVDKIFAHYFWHRAKQGL